MKTRYVVILLVLCLGGAVVLGEEKLAKAPDSACDLWILSGQSNACGRGRPPGLPVNLAVEAFNPENGKWMPALDPLPGMGTKGVGPWHAAAVTYATLTKRTVRLAGSARGGSDIKLWNPTDGIVWKSLSGVLDRVGKGAGVFLWYQGEANCVNGRDQYMANFKDLAERVRHESGNPGITVVVVQLSAHQPGYVLDREPPAKKRIVRGSASQVMLMREIQRQCVLSDPEAILVTAMGRKTQDFWHLSTEGQIELGREIGRALAARLQKVDTAWPGPVLDAAVLGDDGKTVTAHFAEVMKLSGVTAADFCVVSGTGPSARIRAVASKAEALGNTRITVTFDEPVELPASLVYGAGDAPAATLVDEAGNRAPAVQLEIRSGRLPDDKETAAPNGAGIGNHSKTK
jgi:hypothetical protein